jgi:hypothetical protein
VVTVTLFGHRYPRELQEAMHHAERLCAVLSRLEGKRSTDIRRAWLIGRREEIEKVLGLIVGDWRESRRTDERAASSVREYLDDLHRAVRHHFGLEAVLDCCFGDAVATEPIHLEDATRQVHLPRPVFAPSDTVADPLALVKWLKVKG